MITLRKLLPFLKYCLVGALVTFVDLAALYIFVEYGKFGIFVSTACSFFLAVVVSFFLNKIWTFKNKSKNYRKLFTKFFIISIVGLGLTLSLMFLLTKILLVWYIFAKAITSFIVLLWNFFGNKLWTFKTYCIEKRKSEVFLFDISIIIPAFNEEKRLGKTLSLVHDYIQKNQLNAEIIVINDGSKDKTVELVEDFMKKMKNLSFESYAENRGKGYAVKKGVFKSRGKYILFTDADNSTPIEELGKFLTIIQNENVQIVIGSRYVMGSKIGVKQSKLRIMIGRVGNFIISLFLFQGIKDTQCGFKLFQHEVAKEIFSFQKVEKFAFDMEILFIAKLAGYKIREVPVSWNNSSDSRVRPFQDTLITLKDLIYIKLNFFIGRYEYEEDEDCKGNKECKAFSSAEEIYKF